jgi:two-component system phosphate regulon sensor histidine kinase PhoR
MAAGPGGSARGLGLALFVSLPALIALVALVLWGRLAFGPAALAWLATLVIGALLIQPLAVNLGRFVRFAERAEARAPSLWPGPFATDLAEAARRLGEARESHLREAEALRSETLRLLDALPDALLMLGREGRVVRANQAARALFGEALQGRAVATVARHPALLAAIEDVQAGGGPETVEIEEHGGTHRFYEALIEAMPVKGEIGPALLVILRDRTAVKRAEQMRADFVANASHEIRSPLATIVGFIETLRGPAREDAAARDRFLAIMAEQGQRMTRLVEDLLSLSRIEMNEHTHPSGRVEVARVLGRVRDALAWEAQAKSMTIALDAAPDLPAIRGEEAEIEQVVHNLVGNSLKYGHARTEVGVRAALLDRPPADVAWSQGAAVAIAVTDVSDGIAREHIPRLTERFYRVDAARSRSLGGTGLGLAIVKHVINRHRGALHIESVTGQGSTFTVYLPVA